jgi:hypothetical protein
MSPFAAMDAHDGGEKSGEIRTSPVPVRGRVFVKTGRASHGAPKRPRGRISEADLRKAARAYMSAPYGRKVEAVMAACGVERSAAEERVRRAKAAGYIPR